MIVLRMEMWPHGDQESAYPLGSARIWNVGGTRSVGEYKFELFDKAGKSYKRGVVEQFPRLRLLAWDLLYRVLNAVVGHRNGGGNVTQPVNPDTYFSQGESRLGQD